MKLPIGSPWQDDIRRYCQSLPPEYRLFNFARPTGSSSRGEATLGPLPSEVVIPLHEAQTWRGEYFLLARAHQFFLMVVAYRLQSMSATSLSPHEEDENPTASGSSSGAIGAHRRPSYLSVCCSLNPQLVTQVGKAVQSIVQRLAATSRQSSITNLANQWDHYWPELVTDSPQFLASSARSSSSTGGSRR